MSRVLVVEDSVTTLKVLESLLERNGFEVYSARDALTAMSELHTVNPDVLLLDIMLPGWASGVDLCVMARRQRRFDHMPIIMLTASMSDTDARLASQFGADAYLRKPVEDEELIATIKRCLAEREVFA